MRRIFGAHTVDNGGIHMAVRRAGKSGMTAIQLFSAIPKYYGDKTSIRPERVQRFKEALQQAGIKPENVLVHAAYVLNTATADNEKWVRAAAGLRKELERSTALGAGAFCFHPGAATDGDRDTAGAGMTMGKTPAEIGAMLAAVPAKLRSRTGYGLDTCHLFSSGHDITASAAALEGTLDAFEQAAGEPPSFFHLNDSEGALGSNRDRHVLIGDGKIGVEPFRWLVQDRRSAGIPLILETPQQNMEIGEDDDSPDPYDVRMMELLRSFEA
jgi:deoxyribonuclease IV